jgi:carboxymethylenebutenolidase
MRRVLTALIALVVLAPMWSFAQSTPAVPPATTPAAAVDSVARDPNLPAHEHNAKAALDTSPRHGEMVEIAWAKDKPPLRTWVAFPERKDKAGVVIVIQEIFGLTDWLRAVGDQLAREGFIALVPDLISGLGPNGGGTESVASRDEVVKLVRGLTPDETLLRLNAVRAYAAKLPASSGKVATMGFCWGGARSFAYAAATPPPDAAVVYYGSSPDSAAVLSVKAPVLGLYGGDDARVNATIEPAKAALKPLNRFYEANLYEGAGHGFLRAQLGREGANMKATQQAWPRTIAFLREHLEAKKKGQ